MTGKSLFRCAVYTRKSTEEGLEQEFNSLDAQREACEAFIRSQGGLGWKLVSRRYDDGGVSGRTMERPALQQLLSDINAKTVDVVVVYKIDRLTRSLMDFSRMVEVFDTHEVSFVSVTQQFNTTTSMGRLTLNVLLSFAQFEREVTAERIRDKIAASKKKGIWMGGPVPLGYDLKDRQLLVNETEAATVRRLYQLYLELGSVRLLKAKADRLDIKTKDRSHVKGPFKGLRPFTRGNLYRLISNPIYLGRIEHLGTTYEGQHSAIIDQALWDRVQAQLRDKTVPRQSVSNVSDTHILTGLVFDETGDRLSPTHARNHGRRYRYYISNRLMEAHRKNKDGWRLPADKLERAVLSGLIQFLSNRIQLFDKIQILNLSAAETEQCCERLAKVVGSLQDHIEADQLGLLQRCVTRIELKPGQIQIAINGLGLLRLMLPKERRKPIEHSSLLAPLCVQVPFTLKRRGMEARIVLNEDNQKTIAADPALLGIVAKAYYWTDILTSSMHTLQGLAKAQDSNPTDVSRILPLAFLAPDIVEAIIKGRQATGLTVTGLKRLSHLPYKWQEQRAVLGVEQTRGHPYPDPKGIAKFT